MKTKEVEGGLEWHIGKPVELVTAFASGRNERSETGARARSRGARFGFSFNGITTNLELL